MAETSDRRLVSLRAGHYKFITVIHGVCCIGMLIFGITVLVNSTGEGWPYYGSVFVLVAKLFVLSVTDIIIATRGSRLIRNQSGRVSSLVALQAVLSVISLLFYGFLFYFNTVGYIFYRNDLLIVGNVLIYVCVISALFSIGSFCYALPACDETNYNSNQNRQTISTIRLSERSSEPPSYNELPYTEHPITTTIHINEINSQLPQYDELPFTDYSTISTNHLNECTSDPPPYDG